MIIWSGWGFLVIFFFLIGAIIGLPVGAMFPGDPDVSAAATVITAGLVAGLAAFLFVRKVEGGEGRAFIDEATGERIVVKRSAGSLFFIPVRYWAYAAPVLAILFGALLMAPTGTDPAAVPVVEAPAAAPRPPA